MSVHWRYKAIGFLFAMTKKTWKYEQKKRDIQKIPIVKHNFGHTYLIIIYPLDECLFPYLDNKVQQIGQIKHGKVLNKDGFFSFGFLLREVDTIEDYFIETSKVMVELNKKVLI